MAAHLHVDAARVDEVEEPVCDGRDRAVAALERLAAQEVLKDLGLRAAGRSVSLDLDNQTPAEGCKGRVVPPCSQTTQFRPTLVLL